MAGTKRHHERLACLPHLILASVGLTSAAAFAPCSQRGRPLFATASHSAACKVPRFGANRCHSLSCNALPVRVRVSFLKPTVSSLKLVAEGGEGGKDESAGQLDPRFYDLFDRSQSKVDQLERTDNMAATGFELDDAVLLNQRGERVDPETLRDTSVGKCQHG